MHVFFEILKIFAPTTGLGVFLLIWFSKRLGNYTDEKLLTEMNKDLEKVKGEIQRNIEDTKILESRFDIKNNRYVSFVTNKRIELLKQNEDDFSCILSKAFLIESIENLNEFKKVSEDIIYHCSRIKLTLKVRDRDLLELLFNLEKNIRNYSIVSFSTDEERRRDFLDIDDAVKDILHDINENLNTLVELSRINLRDKWDEIKREAREGIN